MTPAEFARKHGLPTRTVSYWCQKGLIPCQTTTAPDGRNLYDIPEGTIPPRLQRGAKPKRRPPADEG